MFLKGRRNCFLSGQIHRLSQSIVIVVGITITRSEKEINVFSIGSSYNIDTQHISTSLLIHLPHASQQGACGGNAFCLHPSRYD